MATTFESNSTAVSSSKVMERSLDPNNHGEWIRICQQGDWESLTLKINDDDSNKLPPQLIRWVIRSRHVTVEILARLLLNDDEEQQLHQINRLTGTLLHEAIQYCQPTTKVGISVCEYVLSRIMQMSSNNRQHLLCVVDGRGRTVLHVLLQTWQRTNQDGLLDIFVNVAKECPQAIVTMDSDGNTPLMLLLFMMSSKESVILKLVQILVETQADVVSVAPKRNIPYQTLLYGDIRTVCFAMTPLYCAIMANRSVDIIRLVVCSSREECERIVTPHRETPLLVAVTANASIEVLSCLSNGSITTKTLKQQRDSDGLSPLDWLWLVFVRGGDPHPSRRRYLPEYVTERKQLLEHQLTSTNGEGFYAECVIQRLRAMLLPDSCNGQEVVTAYDLRRMLHIMCRVQCPMALISILMNYYHEILHGRQPNVASHRDACQRLPIHYAATKQSYNCCYRVGIFGRTVQTDYEDATDVLRKLVNCFPEGVRTTDGQNQLPLHMAIEANGRLEHSQDEESQNTMDIDDSSVSSFDNMQVEGENRRQHSCSNARIRLLLEEYPAALVRRDGKSFLYPALQAAAVESPQLTLIYELLRLDPTVLLRRLHVMNA